MFIEDIVFVGGGYAAEMGGKERAEHVEILCSCCHTCNFILVASIRDELREGREGGEEEGGERTGIANLERKHMEECGCAVERHVCGCAMERHVCDDRAG